MQRPDFRYWHSMALEGSPLAVLQSAISAEMAQDRIHRACQHPATADLLTLPRRILGCDTCVCELTQAADALSPPDCSACGESATRTSVWISGTVTVIAVMCDGCG